RIEPRAVVDYVWASGVRIGAQLGYLVRPKTALLEAEINDELTAGIGAGVPLDSGRKFHLLGEATMRVGVLAGHIDRSELPIELTAGGRYFHPSGGMFEVGMGTGLNAGVGSPDYRVIAGVTYRHDVDHDPDHDGLL